MASKSRRKAREAALRALYEMEVGGTDAETALETACAEPPLSEDISSYARALVHGVENERKSLDSVLSDLIQGYDFDRLAAIDRNILRLAAYEIVGEPKIPPAVTINEAIEIAKRYSTVESGRFVNGVLARFLELSPKADWQQQQQEPEEEAEVTPMQVEEVSVVEDSPEATQLKRLGNWKIRTPSAE